MTDKTKRYLILAPHTDDAELGCGGIMSRLLREGNDVSVLVFSKAFPLENYDEFKKSMREMGMEKGNLFYGDFPIRYLSHCRQEVLDKIINIKDRIEPDIIFIPSTNDFHQDHKTVCEEGIRAFRNKTLFGYEYPWNILKTNLNCFWEIEKVDLDKKINALGQYASQKNRQFMNKDFIRSWAELNGIKMGVKYAEAFEVIRLIK